MIRSNILKIVKFKLAACTFIILTTCHVYANPHPHKTIRVPLLTNEEVNVWEAIVYPGKANILKMHRHEYNRVIVAIDSGTLAVTNDKGQVHYLKFKKDMAYYLAKDIPGEWHSDENKGSHPMRVFVIELKK